MPSLENTDSPSSQKKYALQFTEKPLKLGDKWYLISSEWYSNWANYIGLNTSSKSSTSTPDKISNQSILEYNTETKQFDLKQSLVEETDYFTVPEELWKYLVSKYSVCSTNDIIERFVINDSMDDYSENLKIEIRRLIVRLTSSNWDDTETRTVIEYLSRQTRLETLITHMRTLFNIPVTRQVRLFYKTQFDQTVIDVKEDTTLVTSGCGMNDTILIEVQDESSINNNNNTKPKTSSTPKLNAALALAGAIPAPPPLQQTTPTPTATTTRQSSARQYEYSYSNRQNDYKPGLCGLSNLGNTCFMNSSLQCMSNVPLLTDYFRQGTYKGEINKVNPLGRKGEIAEAYADLINEIWSGNNSYTIPRNFKLNLSRFAPQFTGFQQQDSQELLAFLLDGIHEDLNRIIKKPYVELGSHVGKTDEEFAEESWQDHKKRNDSIIVDTFHGLLKSTLNCLVCGEISIKFDPFCYLSVPLPSKKERLIEVFYVPLDQSKSLVKYKLTVVKSGTMLDLCASLEALLDKEGALVPKNRMVVCDIYSNKFFKIYEPSESISSIRERDDIYIYELATNLSNPDYLKVKLHLREKSQFTNSNCFGLPLFYMVPKENQTYGTMYHHTLKVLKRFMKDVANSSDEINSKMNNSLNVNDDDEVENGHVAVKEDHDDDDVVTGTSQTSLRSSERLKAKSTKLFNIFLTKSENSDYDLTSQPTDDAPFEWPLPQTSNNTSTAFNNSQNNQIACLVADFSSNSSKRLYNRKSCEEFVEDQSCASRLVNKKDVINISDCFSLYTKIEELSEQDYWYCPKCKSHQASTKKFDLWKLPNVLVVHLKRFSCTRLYRDKLDSLVDFPVKDLDMSSYLINKNAGETRYNLIAVSNHYGSLGGGHYTAYGLNRCDGRWYYFDDSSVSSSDESNVCTNAAYMLVYLRKDLFEECIKDQSGSFSEKMDH